MSMYSLQNIVISIKKVGRLQQYYGDEPVLDGNGAIVDFPTTNNSALFSFN